MNNRKVIKSGNHISDERAYDIIKAPVSTEKATNVAQYRQFTFEVAKDANKIELKDAFEKVFKVKVDAVNTLNRKGKEKRSRGKNRTLGRRPDRKFATVTLAEGHIIDTGVGLE